MNKPLFLFVGMSASGKTTIASMLEQEGYTQISSYTTRPKRYENELGHVFITDEEYDRLENIMASTLYNGHRYCTTLEQINNADIYVVDVEGVNTLLHNYHRLNRSIHIIYFSSSVHTRIQRMIERGDSDSAIVGRLLNDEKTNWLNDLYKCCESNNKTVSIHLINADLEVHQVYESVKMLIERIN